MKAHQTPRDSDTGQSAWITASQTEGLTAHQTEEATAKGVASVTARQRAGIQIVTARSAERDAHSETVRPEVSEIVRTDAHSAGRMAKEEVSATRREEEVSARDARSGIVLQATGITVIQMEPEKSAEKDAHSATARPEVSATARTDAHSADLMAREEVSATRRAEEVSARDVHTGIVLPGISVTVLQKEARKEDSLLDASTANRPVRAMARTVAAKGEVSAIQMAAEASAKDAHSAETVHSVDVAPTRTETATAVRTALCTSSASLRRPASTI